MFTILNTQTGARMRVTGALCLLGLATLHWADAHCAEPKPVGPDDPLPFGQSPVDYLGDAASDPVATLNKRLAEKKIRLEAVSGRGYLDAVLKALAVPVSSQLLVYSKTAVNQRLITPRTPRAIYFNESVSVAWVPGTRELEVMSVDPVKGAMFYVLSQPSASEGASPEFHRKTSCLACHIGRTTLSVPGGIVRSFLVDQVGKPLEGYSRVTGATRIANRWGGWYVTGELAGMSHMGNLVSREDNRRHKQQPGFRASLSRLSTLADLSGYLNGQSDVVAHLVFDHQCHGQNLLARVTYEHLLERRSGVEHRLLRYLLLDDHPTWDGTVRGTTDFRQWFQTRGPRDDAGRSLRQLDLKTRLFRHRLSYLVYSPQLHAMPGPPRRRLGERLAEVLAAALAGQPVDGIKTTMTRQEAADVQRILRETRDALPRGWADILFP
tara:strand:- start:76 stop:1389 length:1314 start_codon:yes stop_codon:yes gene_type:complete